MKIQNVSLYMEASSRSSQQTERTIAGAAQASSQVAGNPVSLSVAYAQSENVRLESQQSGYLYSRSQISSANQPEVQRVSTQESLIQSMVSHAFSREVRITTSIPLSIGNSSQSSASRTAIQASVAFGQSYRYRSEQQTSLTIEGRLQLADQRQIDFVLHTRMDSRLLFESGSGEFAAAAVRTDPLIINLQGGMAQLTDMAFEFDLDGDGTAEKISMATGGSGFLAFDRNGDGKINDGSELFGTRTGNGFAELAAYDDDGNGFIDEADAIFAQLKFWQKDEKGNDHLISLADAGIGAIGLQYANTPLQLRGQAGQDIGLIRSTGFYVMENGDVGTVQQVDLSNRDTTAEARFVADFGNAQLLPNTQQPGTSSPTPEAQQPQSLEDWLNRLNSLRDEYMAQRGMDDDSDKDAKSLLEQLVTMLEQQVQEMAEKRKPQAP